MVPEAKVGALFLAAVLLITGVVVFLGQYTTGWGQYKLVIHFDDVQGLAPGTEVRLAGVKVGKVERVALEEHEDYPEKPVAVYLMIDTNTNLYDADEFVIQQAGLLGDQHLSIRRLDEEQLSAKYGKDYEPKALGPGGHHTGAGVVGLAKVTEQTQQLLEQANKTLGQIRDTFADVYTRDHVREILLNINNATAKTNLIADRILRLADVLTQTAEQGQPQVAATLATVAETAADLKDVSTQVKRVVKALAEGPLAHQMALTSANIHQASENVRATTEVVREVIAGPEGAPRLEQMLVSIAVAAANVEEATAAVVEIVGDEQIAVDMKATLANLRATSASLKAISTRTEEFMLEEDTLENIRTSLQNIKAMSEEGVEATHSATQVLQRVDKTMDRLGGLARPFRPHKAAAYWDFEATEDVGLRADMNLRLQYGEDPLDFWRFGVRDMGGDETLTLQGSIGLGPRTWGAVGLLKSKVGASLNYQMTPDMRWQLEAYDPDETQFDLRGIYQLAPEWYLTLGMADSFGSKQPFVGLRRWTTLRPAQKDEE